jgi:hypothetical protein
MEALARTTVVLLIAAAALAPPALADSTPSPAEAVADLNARRAQVGVDADGDPRTAFARTWRFRTAGRRGRTGRVRTGLRVTGLRRRGRALRFTLRGGKARGRRASY